MVKHFIPDKKNPVYRISSWYIGIVSRFHNAEATVLEYFSYAHKNIHMKIVNTEALNIYLPILVLEGLVFFFYVVEWMFMVVQLININRLWNWFKTLLKATCGLVQEAISLCSSTVFLWLPSPTNSPNSCMTCTNLHCSCTRKNYFFMSEIDTDAIVIVKCDTELLGKVNPDS